MTRILLTAVALTAAIVPAAAFANVRAPLVEVRHGDLDLSSAEGRERLSKRVATAADSACVVRSATSLADQMAARACVRVALQAAQPRVAAAIDRAGQRLALSEDTANAARR